MKENCLAIYDMLTQEGYSPNEIISFGRSIGTGMASYLATQRRVSRLILLAPYTSIKDLTKEKLGCFGTVATCCMPQRINFQNIYNLQEIDCPLLMIHGKMDEVIPCEHSLRLIKIAKSQFKKLELRNGMTHNQFDLFRDIIEPIKAFEQLF